jgi:hypothetical protein
MERTGPELQLGDLRGGRERQYVGGLTVRNDLNESTDGGRAIDIRLAAKVEGERMGGTAKIGDRAEGAFAAERTAS